MPEAATVLIVEDDPTIRAILETALRYEGLTVRSAGTGRAAIDAVKQACPQLVLLDMMLPDMPGAEVAAGLQARCGQAVPIIAVSADAALPAKAAAAGAVAHVAKPFDMDKLLDLVQEHLPKAA